MLYFPNGRVALSQELPVAAGVTIAAEGLALIADALGGVGSVKPSTGASGEVFVGVSVGMVLSMSSIAKVEEVVVPAGAVVTLDKTPSSGTLAVYDFTAAAVIATGGGGWTLSGRDLTLQGSHVGHSIAVYYKYAPTAAEARSIQGDVMIGGPAGLAVNQIGVMKNGTIFTSEFDSTVNWNATNPIVRLGANGQFTIGGTGTIVSCAIVGTPTEMSPFLGLMLMN